MFRLLKTLFRFRPSRRFRELFGNPKQDQHDLGNAHRNLPTSSERRATADADNSNLLSQSYLDLALKLQPYFPQECSWLEEPDLQYVGERPVSSGSFADVSMARLDGREVALKSYRRYVRFDCDLVRMVSFDKH